MSAGFQGGCVHEDGGVDAHYIVVQLGRASSTTGRGYSFQLGAVLAANRTQQPARRRSQTTERCTRIPYNGR